MKYLVLFLFFLMIALTSTMDYETAKIDEQNYCEMVRLGHWPPYKGEEFCK